VSLSACTCSLSPPLSLQSQTHILHRPAELKDMSIMDPVEADKYKIELTERLRAQGFDTERMYQNAFDDLTDFQNPMFMYVI